VEMVTKGSVKLMLLMLAAASSAMATPAQATFDEKDVVELNGNNFHEEVKRFKYALVEFYAPWCGHCQHLAPEYAKAATELAETRPDVKLVKVDAVASENEQLAKLYGVQGFPTLKWFVGGVLHDKSPMVRQTEEIVRWVKKNSGPPANAVEDEKQLEELQGRKFSVVGFFQDETSEACKAFLEAAEADDTYEYHVVYKKELAEQEQVKLPAVVFFRNFDENKVVFDGKFTKEEILSAVTAHARPRMIVMTKETAPLIFENRLHKILLFKPEEASLSAFKQASDLMELRGKYIFAVIGEEADPEFAKFIGVDMGKDGSELFLFNTETLKKFRHEGSVTVDGIKKFVADFEENKLKSFLKSSPVVEGWDKGLVKEIVSSQWKEFVHQDKHIVVEIYAPWCQHCKQLEPKYARAAEYFDDKYPGEVIFAKMDGTTNEAEDINVGGFPTVLAFPKGWTQQPLDLSEKMRGLKDIVRTVKEAFSLPPVKREGEDAYETAATRFKAAVKKLQGSLEPAAVQLNRAAEHIEKLVEKNARAKRQEL